jgi:hypothetical protein
VCFEHGSVVVVLPAASPLCGFFELEVVVRFIGMDVHRGFCEVAVIQDGRLCFAGQVLSTPADLEVFANGLAADDVVAIEATRNALAIARIIEPCVARVVLADPKSVKRITVLCRQDRRGTVGAAARGRVLGRGMDARRADALAPAPDISADAAGASAGA